MAEIEMCKFTPEDIDEAIVGLDGLQKSLSRFCSRRIMKTWGGRTQSSLRNTSPLQSTP